MAAAVRLARTALIGVGPFGRRTAELIAALVGDPFPVGESDPDSAFDASPAAVVVASWRPAPGLCERVDRRAHATGIPWLPAILDNHRVSVGPWVSPGDGPCFRCYYRRRIQHDPDWATTAAVHRAFDIDPACGPVGYLPHQARAAAGVAATYVHRGWADPAAATGSVTVIPPDEPTPAVLSVVACHGCDRCGTEGATGALRDALLRSGAREGADAR